MTGSELPPIPKKISPKNINPLTKVKDFVSLLIK